MALVIDQDGNAVDLPQEKIPGALSSGTHAIPMVNPNGEMEAAESYEQAHSLLKQGYRQPNQDESQNMVTTTKFSTPVEQAKTFLEGAGQGMTFGLSSAVERAIGVKPEDIQDRAHVNPWAHGLGEVTGIGASAFIPIAGAANIAGAAGETVAHALPFISEGTGLVGGISRAAAKGAVEGALFSSGDEASKFFLSDPHQGVETALANIGGGALFGGAAGGAIGTASGLWQKVASPKWSEFVSNFQGRMQERMENPNPTEALFKELQDWHGNTMNAADEVFGAKGLKAQAIAKNLPSEMTPAISEQVQRLSTAAEDAVKGLEDDPLANRLRKLTDKFQASVTNPEAKVGDIFDATQRLKQELQEYSKFGKFAGVAERDFINATKDLGFQAKTALEDGAVWGKAADFQKGVNKAFSDFLPSLKDFQSKFMTKVGGDLELDPGKVEGYLKLAGKERGTLRKEMLGNFLEKSKAYRETINGIYSDLGAESPIPPSSLNIAEQTLGKMHPGAQLADKVIESLPGMAGKTIGGGLGAAAGSAVGAPGIGAYLGQTILGGPLEKMMPGLTKYVLNKSVEPGAFKGALDLALAFSRGEKLISDSAANMFKAGSEVLPKKLMSSDADLSRLSSHVENIRGNPEKLMDVGGKSGHYLPDHATALSTSAARISGYLNSVAPNVDPRAPMDGKRKPNDMEISRYRSALKIAHQPLSVMEKIKSGNYTLQDHKDFVSMFPGLYQNMQNKITQAMVDHQASGKMVPYETRLGLSKFLGQPLDSTIKSRAGQGMPTPMPGPGPGRAPGRAPQSGLNKLGSKTIPLSQTPNQALEAKHAGVGR